MGSELTKKIYNIWLLLGILFLVSFFFPEKVLASYTTLPHQFDTQIASGDKDYIQGYLVTRTINSSYYNRNYSGFRYYIPPGTIRARFWFLTTAPVNGGPEIYVASRFNAEPQATIQDFRNTEENLPEIGINNNAAKMVDLLATKGYMGKRVAQNLEQVWIHTEFNTKGILPPGISDTGGYVYVNLFNKAGGNSIRIRSIQGFFEVISSEYNGWRDSMDFSSPEPVEPTFDFTLSSRTNAELGQVYTANVSFSNFNEEKDISILGGGGEYRISSGNYTSEPGKVKPDQSVSVRLTSSSDYSTLVQTTLKIGDISRRYEVRTKPDPDNVSQTIYFYPNPMSGQLRNTWVESNEIEVVADAQIRISAGGEYKINNGSWTSENGEVKIGDKVVVRLKSSPDYYRTVEATLYIGSVWGTFKVNTARGSEGSSGGGNSPLNFDPCSIWPERPQCGESPPKQTDPDPETGQEKEVWVPSHLKKFNIKEIPSQGRNGPESLEFILELPENWPENGGQGNAYMYGLLDIPERGQFLAQMDIFENIFLFPYHEGDPLFPFKVEILNGQKTVRLNPFVSLHDWEYTAEDLAGLKAVFYVAIISDVNWGDWLGGSFTFTASSGGNINVHAPPPASLGGDNDSGGSDDSLPSGDSLRVEAGHLEFYYNSFQVSGEGLHQPLGLDINLPHGWKKLLGQDFEGADTEKIEWSVYAMVVVDDMQDQQFLARSDIHLKPRLVHFNGHTPLRPAAWTKELSAGSGFVDLFPGIDDLELTARDFAQLGLDFYVALVPEGNWNNFFGVHFTFQE